MNSQMIETIEHRMMTHLDAHQQKILHDTLCQCLEEERLKANDDDNQNFLKVFLAAKRVEGCSEKTVRYYDSTIRNVLDSIGKNVKAVTTDDLRMYLD